MKKLCLIPLYLLLTLNLSAQNWFTNNPEWCSGTTDIFVQLLQSSKTFVDGDTLIDNQNYKILKKRNQQRNLNTQDTTYTEFIIGLVYEADEKVYSRTAQGNDEIIYDFTLELGDTMSLPNSPCGDINMILDGTGNEVLNGETVRYQDFLIAQQSGNLDDLVRVYEGIGLIFGPWHETSGYLGFYPESNFFCGWYDPPVYFFNYSNDLYEHSIMDGECNFLDDLTTNTIDHQIESELTIYPNPCTNEFRIKGNEFNIELYGRLTNIHGKVLKELRINNNQIINISDFSHGLYFLELYSEHKIVDRKILIKSSN